MSFVSRKLSRLSTQLEDFSYNLLWTLWKSKYNAKTVWHLRLRGNFEPLWPYKHIRTTPTSLKDSLSTDGFSTAARRDKSSHSDSAVGGVRRMKTEASRRDWRLEARIIRGVRQQTEGRGGVLKTTEQFDVQCQTSSVLLSFQAEQSFSLYFTVWSLYIESQSLKEIGEHINARSLKRKNKVRSSKRQ